MPEYRFDSATVGLPVDDRRVGVELDPAWNVDGRILNGGYLQAVAVRAAATLLGDPGDPVAVSTSFAAPAVAGPAEVTVEVLRRGGRLTAVSAVLRQGQTVVLATLATFGTLPPRSKFGANGSAAATPVAATPAAGTQAAGTQAAGTQAASTPEATTAGSAALAAGLPAPRGETTGGLQPVPGSAPPMPAVPGPAECLRVPSERLPGPPGLAELLDIAFVPAESRWLAGDTSAGPVIRCWLSFADGRALDPLALVALADMAPPVSFAQSRFGWAPTLQIQVGVFARPCGRHVLLHLRGEPYDGDFVAEDGLMWDAAGTLVARSRQIAVPPRT